MPNRLHVALGTISFTVCFAAWGLIGAFAPHFRETYHLSPSETALLIAVPVLLGAPINSPSHCAAVAQSYTIAKLRNYWVRDFPHGQSGRRLAPC